MKERYGKQKINEWDENVCPRCGGTGRDPRKKGKNGAD